LEHLGRIRALVARVKRRVRLQTALRRWLILGAIGLLIFGVSVLLVKLRVAPPVLTWISGTVAIVLAAGGLLSGLLQRFDEVTLASALDRSSGLHSRLGSALAFAQKETPTEFEQAAIADAATVLDQANPKLAAPWQWSAFVGATAFAAIALLVSAPTVLALEIPVSPTDGAALGGLLIPGPPGADQAETKVTESDKAALEAAVESVEAAKTDVADTEVAKFLDDLNALLRALKDGELTPEEVHRKLAALDKAKDAWTDQHAKDIDKIGEDLQKAAAKQRRAHKEMDPLLEAMRDKQWKEAAEALERTAKKAEREALKKRDKNRIGKDLEKLAKSLETKVQKEEERLKKSRNRLKKKQEAEKDRFSKKNRDRLKQTDRRLEELRRERQQMSEARRQLEKLQRNLSQAAKDMLRRQESQQGRGGAGQKQGAQGQQGAQGAKGQNGQKGPGSGAEQMRQAAEMLRRLGEQGQGAQKLRVAEGRMVDVREMMRRAGKQKSKQGKGGKQAGKKGGKQGQKGEPGEMGRFLVRAGGEQAEGQAGEDGKPGGKGGKPGGKGGAGDKGLTVLEPGGKGGKPGGMVLLGGSGKPGGTPTPLPGSGQGDAGGQGQPGSGVGAGHDGIVLGKSTKLNARFQEHFVAGQKGAGASESIIIQTAASKGFTGARYRKVHQDYTEVVEDSLDRQKIPAGKRRYVRRYFDLIRPR
jgi:hypothetical protein